VVDKAEPKRAEYVVRPGRRHRRVEGPDVVEYTEGDRILLTDRDYARLGAIVEPYVPPPPAAEPPPPVRSRRFRTTIAQPPRRGEG